MYNELYHHGILGMKWGIRRYQNEDGSLTSAGKMRYRKDGTRITLANMTDEEYDYNMRQMAKEKAYKDLRRSSSGIDFSSNEAIKIAASVLGSVGTVVLTEAVMGNGIKGNEELAKKILLMAGTSTIGAITRSLGGNINTSIPNSGSNAQSRNITAKVGSPTNPGTYSADAEKRYQAIFKTDISDENRGLVKSMRKQGYDIDQIEKFLYHGNLKGIGWRVILT